MNRNTTQLTPSPMLLYQAACWDQNSMPRLPCGWQPDE
jgi:hypothetical protein